MPVFAYERVRVSERMVGLFILNDHLPIKLNDHLPIKTVIRELSLLLSYSDPVEFANRVEYLPL
mgnify:CR=1 FL=1